MWQPGPAALVHPASQPWGGVRFPELDLPLGRLAPVSIPLAVTTSSAAVCGNSGGFAPFPPAALAGRYSAAEYRHRYGRRLKPLIRGGYLRSPERGSMLDLAEADFQAATAVTALP